MTDPRSGLVARVTAAAVSSAALGGLIAAVVAIAAVDWLVTRHADRRLMGAAATLAGELDEEAKEQDESLQEVLDDENAEMVTSGIRLALYKNKALIAGDSWVPHVGSARCVSRGDISARVRACARRYASYRIVAAEDREDQVLQWFYLIAGAAAVSIGAAVGGVAGVRLARRAIAPLSELTRKLRLLTPEAPNPDVLSSPVGVAEVDAVRHALHETLSRLRDHVGYLERFAAGAAHELKTPLTLLRGELELLAEEMHHDSAVYGRLSAAAARATRLAEMTDSLLFLALPMATVKLDAHPIAISEVVAEVVQELPANQQSRIEVSVPEEGLVRGEPGLLRVMLRNALDNALKYSDTRVEVQLVERDELVILTIADQGPGIRSDLQKRVFEPFFRVTPEPNAGYGLGLALVGHIARAHGGTAGFEQVRVGSSLRVTLPAWASVSA